MYYLKNLDGVYINGFLNKVGDVHNDILKSYIDMGFFMFLYFIYYFIVSNYFYFYSKGCIKTSILYLILISYTVVLMLFDNIIRYDLYLITLFAIPMLYKKEEIEYK